MSLLKKLEINIAMVKILEKIDVKSNFVLGDPVWFSTGAYRWA